MPFFVNGNVDPYIPQNGFRISRSDFGKFRVEREYFNPGNNETQWRHTGHITFDTLEEARSYKEGCIRKYCQIWTPVEE